MAVLAFSQSSTWFCGLYSTLQLVSSHIETFSGFRQQTVEVGEFRIGTTKYFSADVGGVVSFTSPPSDDAHGSGRHDHSLTRVAVPGFALSQLIVRRPPETKQQFPITAVSASILEDKF